MNTLSTPSSADNECPIQPRGNLDFDFEGDIPRYWFENDPFKTRFMDAMSTLFPEGERFFISCVRDYRDQITDPVLKQQVKDFIFQEGQHGKHHDRFNDRLRAQGVNVESIARNNKAILDWARAYLPKSWTLSATCAAEHMTAIMAQGFLGDPEYFKDADHRMRALYYWHGVEEIEHKAVAYDVMKKTARVGYFRRVLGMVVESIGFPFFTFQIMNHMFKVDGLKSRWKIWLHGLIWLYGPNGIMLRIVPAYLKYYVPGFHPWKTEGHEAFHRWRKVFEETGGDPVAASNAMISAS